MLIDPSSRFISGWACAQNHHAVWSSVLIEAIRDLYDGSIVCLLPRSAMRRNRRFFLSILVNVPMVGCGETRRALAQASGLPGGILEYSGRPRPGGIIDCWRGWEARWIGVMAIGGRVEG